MFAVVQASSFGWTGTQSVIGYIVFVFMVWFVRIELRTHEPLLRLKQFASRNFSLNSVVTVLGMFAFLGCAAATSIRLTAVQGFSPLESSIGFVALRGFALFLLPLIAWMMPRVNPRWMLGGFLLQAVGAAWAATISINHDSVGAILPPLCVVGVGFGFSVASVTAVAVNTVRIQFAGMASATTSLLRDFGFALGPTVVIAIGTSRAAGKISHALAGSPTLQISWRCSTSRPRLPRRPPRLPPQPRWGPSSPDRSVPSPYPPRRRSTATRCHSTRCITPPSRPSAAPTRSCS